MNCSIQVLRIMAEATTHRRRHLSCLSKEVPQSPISNPVHPDPTFQDSSSQLRRISIIRTSLRSTTMIRATSASRLFVVSSSRTVHMPHTTTRLINHFRSSFPLHIQDTTPPTRINHAWIPDLPWINPDRITIFSSIHRHLTRTVRTEAIQTRLSNKVLQARPQEPDLPIPL